jgi:hypothetical protein
MYKATDHEVMAETYKAVAEKAFSASREYYFDSHLGHAVTSLVLPRTIIMLPRATINAIMGNENSGTTLVPVIVMVCTL